jgi:hypothetical protein
MPNYENGKVYCIRSHATVGCYVGSTIQSLSKRLYSHKRDYNKWIANNNLKYYTSFKVLEHGVDDCYIELIENVSCNDKNELERREGEIMRITDNCVNKNIIGRTNEELKLYNKTVKKKYIENNKEKIKEDTKKYYEDNKEKIKENKKKWCENNKEKNKAYKKKYRDKKKAEKAQ